MSDLDTQIEEAVRKGASLKEIADHLSQSEDESHQAWAKNYFGKSAGGAEKPTLSGPSEKFGKATDEFEAKGDAERKSLMEKNREEVGGLSLPNWMKDVAEVGGMGAAAYGVYKGAQGIMDGLKPSSAENPFAASKPEQTVTDVEAKVVPETVQPEITPETKPDVAAKQAAPEYFKETGTSTEKLSGKFDPQSQQIIQRNIEGKQKEAAKEAVAAVKATSPFLGIKPVMTGSGMPAYEGQGHPTGAVKPSYSSIAEVPKDKIFVPGARYMDVMRQNLGQEEYTKNLKPSGGWPISYDEALARSAEVNKSLGRLSREEFNAANVAKMPNTEGIGLPTNPGGKKLNKVVKVGGVAGALIAASDLANAASAGNLKETSQNIVEGLLPLWMTPSSTSGPEELAWEQKRKQENIQLEKIRLAERQKLGSPYRAVPPPQR